MAKASLILPNGTEVAIEGTAEEVAKLLAIYNAQPAAVPPASSKKTRKKSRARHGTGSTPSASAGEAIDHAAIVNALKNSDEYEAIEEQILDRTSQVDRVLLPLYVAHEYVDTAIGLTSGDVAKITAELGIPVAGPNASRTLSKTAARYVTGDKTRQKGRAVRYRLQRRGIQYMKSVIAGSGNEE